MNLDKFLENQIARSTDQQQDEGVGSFVQNIISGTTKFLTPILNPLKQTVSNFVGSVARVFFKTVKGKAGEIYLHRLS